MSKNEGSKKKPLTPNASVVMFCILSMISFRMFVAYEGVMKINPAKR